MKEYEQPLLISIEGNIGSGKSTLLSQLEKYIYNHPEQYQPNTIVFLKEPVELWENTIDPVTGKNILKLYYENPHKYAFQFQSLVFATQKKVIKETIENNPECRIIISERSIECGIHVFAKMLEDEGIMSPLESHIYNLMIENSQYIKTNAIIYLKTAPHICIERINKRNRDGENNITYDYILNCETYHNKWLLNEQQNIFAIHNNSLDSVLPIINSFQCDLQL